MALAVHVFLVSLNPRDPYLQPDWSARLSRAIKSAVSSQVMLGYCPDDKDEMLEVLASGTARRGLASKSCVTSDLAVHKYLHDRRSTASCWWKEPRAIQCSQYTITSFKS